MFTSVIKIGMMTQKCLSDIATLQRDMQTWTMIHNLNEELEIKDGEDLRRAKSYQESLLREIDPKVVQLNDVIGKLNQVAKLLGSNRKIEAIDTKRLHAVISERFSVVASKDYVEMSNENFHLKVQQIMSKTQKSVQEYIEAHEHISLAPNIDKIKTKKYKSGLKDALDINSMGFYEIGAFTVGKVIEQVVNDYLQSLAKAKKMKRVKLSTTKLDSKIGILKSNKYISEKIFHELSSIKISRNDTGHPLGKKYKREEVVGLVNQTIFIIKYLEGRITKLK